MKRDNTLYKVMNTVFLAAAVFFLLGIVRKGEFLVIQTTNSHILPLLLLCLLCFGVLHGAKCLRFYLVLMEQRIPFSKFIRIYLRTTLVNFLLPLKSGELYRIYCFAHETKDVKMGFISVILDRIFDTCVLLLFLLPFDLFYRKQLSMVTIILGAVVVLAGLGSVFLNSSYGYLNRFLMLHGNSRKTIWFLQALENFKGCYDEMAKLLKGRWLLIFLCSCIGWSFEFIFLESMAALLQLKFGVVEFSGYISTIFEGSTESLQNEYIVVSSVCLSVCLLVAYGLKNRRAEHA